MWKRVRCLPQSLNAAHLIQLSIVGLGGHVDVVHGPRPEQRVQVGREALPHALRQKSVGMR